MRHARPRILLLSGYDAGSHRRWREQLIQALPEYEWHALTLPPRYFSWRIRGNALSWLDSPLLTQHWDLLLATSMVDLVGLKGFHPHLALTPTLLYMHENQFAFPNSGQQFHSLEPQMINLYSAVAADQLLFNSDWNRDSFIEGVTNLLKRLPDRVPNSLPTRLAAKSSTVPVPIDDALFVDRPCLTNPSCPHLLWNHRWEYDKAPERLLNLLHRLKQCGQDFKLSIVGEQFRTHPAVFDTLSSTYASQLLQFGYLPSKAAYHQLLQEADIVISTALHDFQGLSMLEAMASGCLALAPDRLAYPEYIPNAQRYRSHPQNAEKEADSACETLLKLLSYPSHHSPPEAWRLSHLTQTYRKPIEQLLGHNQL